jgi:hypothetical protein
LPAVQEVVVELKVLALVVASPASLELTLQE